MIHYYYGEDTYAAREAINDLARKDGARLRWVDKNDVMELGAAQIVAQGNGGLFGKEMLVIRDPGEMATGTQDELVAALKVVSGGQYVLWDRAEPKKRFKIYKEFGKQGRQFEVPGIRDLSNWLVGLAREKQVDLGFEAAKLLVERVGFSRWELMSELEKLSLTKNKITEDDVKKAVSANVQAEIFSVLEALVRGEKARTVEGINILLEEGNGEFYILSMLAYQFRTLFVVRSGIDKGKNQFDVVRESGMKQYSVQKSWDVAKKQPAVFWRSALTRVLATDFAIRQGKVDARTGVLMLVVGLV